MAGARRAPRVALAGIGIWVLVLLWHALLVWGWAALSLPPQLSDADAARAARIQVRFVRQLAPALPPEGPPLTWQAPPPPAPRPLAWPQVTLLPPAPDAAAAAEPGAAAASAAAIAAAPMAAPPAPDAAPAPGPPAHAASAPPAPPAVPPAMLGWPPSTRLRYALTGNYRGPVEGSAQVEWLREGARYQVFLDVTIGVSFAPLVTRRMRSDGEIGPDGLRPRRYEEHTKIMFRAPRPAVIEFDAAAVRLPGGRRVLRPPGVQDSVSQFVQLTWRFTEQPWLLATGQVLQMPLALPRQVDRWVYDVMLAETLYTPSGPVQAVHVKPRREPRPGGDLVAEAWFAPALQYLPVRILIRQDADTYVDLLLDRLPEQALADPAQPASAPKRVP